MYQDNHKPTNKLSIWLPLLFAIVLVTGMLIGMKMQSNAPTLVVEPEDAPANVPGQGKVEEILRYVEAKYVDEVDREQLLQEVIDEILERLDPHSNYISAEKLREVNEQLEGNFDGIGVEFMRLDDTIIVVTPLPGGPSEAAGVKAGDRIVQIGDTTIAGVDMKTEEVIKMLRGEKGTDVEVGILREGEQRIRRFSITRDEIPMNSVDIAYMLSEEVGYIKINRFSATTYEEFMRELEDMVENQGLEDLVIDLRHNPGGYLQQATNLLSQLFKNKDRLLVYTEGRSVGRNDYESTGRSFFPVEDIVVLIDEGSASASEIVAGAIQDHDRGLIIGRRSFGKGLVQEQYKLRDGSALRLTVARYFTPSGRSIQKDYEDPEQYEHEMFDRYETGELQSEDKMFVADSTEYYTDNGRIVYGGGGIMPDIFIPIDSITMDEQYLELRQYIPQFVFRYMSGAGGQLEDYEMEDFVRHYKVTPQLVDELVGYTKSKGDNLKQPVRQEVREEIARFLKARIGKHLYDDRGFYAVWNQQDAAIQEAVKVLAKPDPLTASQK